VHPPAHRFNAGQKITFWFVILAGASMSFSGICLLFPFTFSPFAETFAVINLFGLRLPTDLSPLQEMQLTHAWHAVLGIFMIVVIIAHIYLASVGMEGAFDGMASGYVDENWAREHHALWMAELNTEPSSDGVERPETPTHDDAPV
jgi:formate dehydrogenase subunit gamma